MQTRDELGRSPMLQGIFEPYIFSEHGTENLNRYSLLELKAQWMKYATVYLGEHTQLCQTKAPWSLALSDSGNGMCSSKRTSSLYSRCTSLVPPKHPQLLNIRDARPYIFYICL